MFRYKNLGIMIEIELQNEYLVAAVYDCVKKDRERGFNELRDYEVIFYIDRKDIEMPYWVNKGNLILIQATSKNIRHRISEWIEKALTTGYFSEAFESYEYIQQCFDKGNELYEEERIVKNNGGVA